MAIKTGLIQLMGANCLVKILQIAYLPNISIIIRIF